jgi:hypothetical protein
MGLFRRYQESMSRKPFLTMVIAVLTVTVTPTGASAAPAVYNGISADGSVAIFSTVEKMVPGDTDSQEDVYQRTLDSTLGEYVTRQVSFGPTGGNDALASQYDGISADGHEVFFSTKEQLVPGDTDAKEDVYLRDLVANKTILASQGGTCAPSCGNGPADSSFVPGGVAPAGGKVFFATTEKLSAADEDEAAIDVYVRDIAAQTTTLVSAPAAACGGCGKGTRAAFFRTTDLDGQVAFFTTVEKLASEDVDTTVDIYVRDLAAGTTALVSPAETCPPDLPVDQNCDPLFRGSSPDGSHVFFETNGRLVPADTDSSQDVYDWSEGSLAISSTGPDGGNGDSNVTYVGTSADGETVYFHTDERLDATGDTDKTRDVYMRQGGATSLVSVGSEGRGNGEFPASFEWASPSGSTSAIVFVTDEPLVSADADEGQDVYKREGGTTTLLSTGAGGSGADVDAAFAGASADASKVFFLTPESLSVKDTDAISDIYLRSSADTTLVSTGSVGGNGPYAAGLHGVSSDGSEAFFVTQERLAVDDDFSNEEDVYSWGASGTLLVSVRNSPDLVLGPAPPALEKTVPTSPGQTTKPTIVGQAAAGALVKIYSTFNCSGEPVAQGTAAELFSPGLTVEVAVALGSTTFYRATAEVEGIVSDCSGSISYKQENPAPLPPPVEEPPTGEPPAGGGTPPGSGGSGGKGQGGITYVAPQTRISFGPSAKTRLRRPTFRFLDATGQPGTRFFCRIDKQRWTACTSPFKAKKLKFGRHVFSVKAVNAIGTTGPGPVKRAFKVVRG